MSEGQETLSDNDVERGKVYRPIYHFMPERNWMNDPNGPIYFNGEYHMFYQYNPTGSQWGNIHWGHASSKDLVHWRHWPVALFPSTELGEVHCFSGCAVDDGGVPTIIYTSIGEGNRHQSIGAEQWMATSSDGTLTWTKYESNPILTLAAHGDLAVKEWRDPFVWRDGGTWYMVLGASCDGKGCALLYQSENLTEWKFLNKILEGPEETWECPNLFKLGDKHVLVYSPYGPVRFHVGTLNPDFTFTSEHSGSIDHSGWEGFYAPNSLMDEYGRRIMWGWVTENPRGEFLAECGWAGIHSVPRELTLNADHRLRMHPIPELEVLRGTHWMAENVTVTDQDLVLELTGKAIEIIAKVELDSASEAPFYLKVLRSQDGAEETLIGFDAAAQELFIDRAKSTLSDLPHKMRLSGHMEVSDGVLTLHVFVDHSVVEVFANYEECISTRAYPTRDDAVYVSVATAAGQMVHLKSIDAWEMSSIWE